MRAPGASPSSARAACERLRSAACVVAGVACALLAGCANQPTRYAGSSTANGRHYDPKLGVYPSPRLVADGEPIPRGGGGYLVGRPYSIGGRTYFPRENAEGYTVVGTASWYGDAFHGRRTANGEIFNKNSISAAHPTLPLPSYVRVTNLKNGRSMIVRVNDRGPYHGGRVMDVSQRVAEALAFKGEGTARIRVDYVGPASIAGSDDNQLLATLREDGAPASIDGSPPAALADAGPVAEPVSPPPAGDPGPDMASGRVALGSDGEPPFVPERRRAFRRTPAPVPPDRPFDMSGDPAPASRRASIDRAGLSHLISFGGAIEPPISVGGQGLAREDRAVAAPRSVALAGKRAVGMQDADAEDR